MYPLTNNLESTKPSIGFFTVKHVLSDDDINRLKEFSSSVKLEKATINEKKSLYNGANYEIRNSSIFWVCPESEDEAIQYIFKKVRSKIIEINETVIEFNLTDIEPMQYTRYYMGDFYKQHVDMESELFIANTCRKLSFSIQLTDPSEYDGGDLLAYTDGTPTAASKEKGSMTLFPSFTLHEVTPVTRGIRNALVGWCWGPKFK